MQYVKDRLTNSGLTLPTAQTLFIIGIIIVAANLRPALTSVGPLISLIREDIGLSRAAAGSLTTLSLLTFAALSPFAPRIARRFGQHPALLVGLGFLLIGILIRYFPSASSLFAGSLAIGAGIAILNVLLPGIIKESFPHHIGLMTSFYTTSMVVTASIGSGIAVPLAQEAGWGWRWSLLIWIVPVIIAIICWSVIMRKGQLRIGERRRTIQEEASIYHSPLAWQVTMFMGLQSIGYYVTITWLPEILNQMGNLPLSSAGWMVSLMQLASLPAAFITPILAGKWSQQRGIILVIAAVAVSGLVLLFFSSSFFMVTSAVILIGIGQGGSISLSLALLSMRASNSQKAAKLSGMAQSIGYLLAALGPSIAGIFFDATGTWAPTICMLMIVSLLQMVAGIGAGRNKEI